MMKLGIDIVDLSDPQIQRRDERTLQMITNKQDQFFDHPAQFWLLWSAKEAVFKCYREAYNFSPTHIPVSLSQDGAAIRFTSGDLEGSIEVSKDYILALCSDSLNEIEYQVLHSEQTGTGKMVRNELVDFFKTKGMDVAVGSDDLNLPILLPSALPISISHHYHWSAFAYPKAVTS